MGSEVQECERAMNDKKPYLERFFQVSSACLWALSSGGRSFVIDIPPAFIPVRRAIRSSRGGWVENKLIRLPALKGLTMNM
jgi:hypothetical protein